MTLRAIAQDAQDIANAIRELMKVDVVIVDENLERVADTSPYLFSVFNVRNQSIIGKVFQSGKPLVVDNKDYFQSCVDCADYSHCQMQGVIGMPIKVRGETVGAIGLVVIKANVNRLLGNVNLVLSFLRQMADLLAGKLIAHTALGEDVSLLAVDSGTVLVDETGTVIAHNDHFCRYFGVDGNCRGRLLSELLPHPEILRALRERENIAGSSIIIPLPQLVFCGQLQVKQIWQSNEYRGAAFYFHDWQSAMPPGMFLLQSERLTRLRTDELCTGETAARLKALQETDDALLLVGESTLQLEKLAFAIHSDGRRGGKFILLRASDVLELDDPTGAVPSLKSVVSLAHQGTLCVVEPFQLPVYVQTRLAELLERRGNAAAPEDLDVRFLFLAVSSDFPPDPLTAYRPLLSRLTPLRLDIPAGISTPLLNRYLEHYARSYGKGRLHIQSAARQALLKFPWQESRLPFYQAMDHLVRVSEGTITAAAVKELLAHLTQGPSRSAKDFEREEIERMLAAGKTYEQIAEALQISRSTIHRRLKKYQLVQSKKGDPENDQEHPDEI